MKLTSAIVLAAIAATSAAAQEFDCVIDPSFQLNLGSPVTGLLEEVYVSRGDRVQSGDAIARLASDIEAVTVTVLQERANSNATVASREARVRLAEQNYARAERLFEQKVTSEQILQEREVELEIAERELAEARVTRRIAALELERAEATLARRTVTSPAHRAHH